MADLTPEQILGQLRTRGFEAGFQPRTPLREFIGRLDNIGGEMVDRFTPPRAQALYNFSEVEVITSTEPYPFPIAQIGIFISVREQSAMGVFGASVDKVINADIPDDAPPEEVKGQDYLIGKVLHMKMTGGHMMWDGATRKEVPRECWELVSVEGEAEVEEVPVKAVDGYTVFPPYSRPLEKPATKGKAKVAVKDATARALELLDGKTENQFYQVVFSDPVVKLDNTGLRDKIIARGFIAPLEAAEVIEKDDDGVYHIVQTG